jgi:hypothetical protein
MELMNQRKVGLSYAATTLGLLFVVALSGWCWELQNLPGGSSTLHAICLPVWVISGLRLAVIQVVFLMIAVRAKTNQDSVPPAETADAQPDGIRVLVILAGALLLRISVSVWLLSQAPS